MKQNKLEILRFGQALDRVCGELFGCFFRPQVIKFHHNGLLYTDIRYIVRYVCDEEDCYTAIVYSLNPPRFYKYNVQIVYTYIEGWVLIFSDFDRIVLFDNRHRSARRSNMADNFY
jgi:hypothetical protein